ncbi:hypothetical protein KUCAC02_003196, partial [Chaenocephalus aceratus]
DYTQDLTKGRRVKSICTAGVSSLTSLQYIDQEEAYTKMVLHAIHLAESYSRIIVRRRRTDQSLHGLELSPGISQSLPRRRPLLLGFTVHAALPPPGARGGMQWRKGGSPAGRTKPDAAKKVPSLSDAWPIRHASHRDPHPAIVPPSGKQEHDHYDRSMYMKPQVEAKREKEPKKPVHQETPERLHAVHEGDEGEGHRRWHALTREEQAKYYELARKERQLHMQLYPTWSARDNYEAGLSGVAGEKSKADWGKKKRRKREKLQDSNTDPGSPKKCRARFGLNQQTDWCGPCRCVTKHPAPPSP